MYLPSPKLLSKEIESGHALGFEGAMPRRQAEKQEALKICSAGVQALMGMQTE